MVMKKFCDVCGEEVLPIEQYSFPVYDIDLKINTNPRANHQVSNLILNCCSIRCCKKALNKWLDATVENTGSSFIGQKIKELEGMK
jgi:hypothetical protein